MHSRIEPHEISFDGFHQQIPQLYNSVISAIAAREKKSESSTVDLDRRIGPTSTDSRLVDWISFARAAIAEMTEL